MFKFMPLKYIIQFNNLKKNKFFIVQLFFQNNSTKIMIQAPNYQKSHQNQIRTLFQKGYEHQLIIHSVETKFYYPSLIKHKFYSEVISKLQNKKNIKAPELCWLIISKAMLEQNYLVHKAKLTQKYGQKWIQIMDKWLQIQQSSVSAIQRPIESVKAQMRSHFEELNQKATKYEYFKMKQVPVYLIATEWLQKFYDKTSEEFIPPINNHSLATLMPFIDTDPKFVHLNYELKSQLRENKDYKIISPEAWDFLYSKFNGTQIKRFTTVEKQPTVQIHYRKLSISLVEDRYFHITNLSLLVPRYTKFSALLERIKRILIAYNIAPFQSLKKSLQFIKAKDLTTSEIIDLIQDDQIQLLQEDDERFQKIELELDVEQAKIYTVEQQIILNFIDQNNKQSDFFSKIQSVQTIITRDSCLNCGNHEDVFLCICKAVHFCSMICQRNHKQHIKQCQKIRRQQMQITKLIKDYQITQKQFQLTQSQILKGGKVGLQNLRNTCYLNSALQCLLRIDKLVQYFARNDHLKDLNVDNVLGSQGHLACSFGELVKKYFTTNKRCISPIDVIRIIAKNPQFRGSQHQDSQQFLNYFLDKLHQDLNRIKSKPYTEEIESNGRSDEIVSAQSWENYLKRNQSFIQELFTGQYRSEIRCPDCDRISITFDPFMSVTLQFPKEQTSLYIKGYLLTVQGQFLKVEVNVPGSTITRNFINKTFKEKVSIATLKNRIVIKQWREDVPISKNFSDQGIILFYVKEKQWQRQINLHFIDQSKYIAAFNRRIYIKNPQNLEQLKQSIYSRIRSPVQKGLKSQFASEQEYMKYCIDNQLLLFYKPKQTELEFPLQEESITLKVQFNPEIKFKQNPKLNQSTRTYDTIQNAIVRKNYSKSGISIHEMIQNFGLPEKLTQDNMWYCNVCKDHKMADKIMCLYRLPQILIMHLKRFNHKNTRYKNLIGVQKIQTTVNVEQKQVINGIEYQLIGVVNHFGSMTFGHYTAYVKKDEWVTYDDSKVKRCNLNGDNAYLVFYKRCS